MMFEFFILSIFFLVFSGLFMILGCIEHIKTIRLIEDLAGAVKNEGTDTD